MSARERLQAAVVAWLTPAVTPVAVFDMPPARAALPHVHVEDPVLARWDLAEMTGFEGQLVVSSIDNAERPVQLRRVVAQVEDAMDTLPADLGGEGWRLATMRLARSRILRGRGGEWLAASQFAVRVYRANG